MHCLQIATLPAAHWSLSARVPSSVRLTHNRSRIGSCKRLRGGRKPLFQISCSVDACKTDAQVRDVLFHELIHTLPGCFDHGRRFREVAAMVNAAYGTDVRATSRTCPQGVGGSSLAGGTPRWNRAARTWQALPIRGHERAAKALLQPCGRAGPPLRVRTCLCACAYESYPGANSEVACLARILCAESSTPCPWPRGPRSGSRGLSRSRGGCRRAGRPSRSRGRRRASRDARGWGRSTRSPLRWCSA